MGLGPTEILLIIVVIALLFGAKKLPELMKGMGQGIREFKNEVKDPEAVQPISVPSQQLEPIKLDPATGQPVASVQPVSVPPTERR